MLVLIYQTWHKGAVRMNHSLLYHSLPAGDKELNGGFDSKKKKTPVTEFLKKSSVITCYIKMLSLYLCFRISLC